MAVRFGLQCDRRKITLKCYPAGKDYIQKILNAAQYFKLRNLRKLRKKLLKIFN